MISGRMSESLPVWFDDTFILTLVGLIGGGGAAVLSYFLRSRCRTVQCGCIRCERDVLALEPSSVTVQA